jgi:hypothetical protein
MNISMQSIQSPLANPYGWMSLETATTVIIKFNDGFRNSRLPLTLRSISPGRTIFYTSGTESGWGAYHKYRRKSCTPSTLVSLVAIQDSQLLTRGFTVCLLGLK